MVPNLLKDQTQIILDSIADGVFTVDLNWKITTFNRAAEKITGISKQKAINRHCWEVFSASICEQSCALGRTMESGEPIVDLAIYIVNSKGDRIPVSISTALLKDKTGLVIGGVETFRDLSVVEALKKELSNRHTFQDIISKNRKMFQLFEMVELLADNDSTVLLVGESGTGKELMAKAIHSVGHRFNGPMITVNCSALPDTLLESELFGYKAGAFTDAKKDKPGRLSLAQGGTLFLDEIGELPSLVQVKLLRVLQEKCYEPLGGLHPEKADVRIIAATNQNLEEMVKAGKFRRDLYYRINVVKLALPPLRERKEDIPLLIEHFIKKFNRLQEKEICRVSPETLDRLMIYDFPGNIRELENILEYASIVCRNSIIRLEHLPENIRNNDRTSILFSRSSESLVKKSEKVILHEALENNCWNRSATAAQLGIHPSTLWRKIKRFGIKTPLLDGRSRKQCP
jgi:PAS domain S-box-containing protein